VVNRHLRSDGGRTGRHTAGSQSGDTGSLSQRHEAWSAEHRHVTATHGDRRVCVSHDVDQGSLQSLFDRHAISVKASA
jgi:hypothetical protein